MVRQWEGWLCLCVVYAFTTWHHSMNCIVYQSIKPQSMILNGQPVGGLTVECIIAWYHIAGRLSLSFKTLVGDIEWSDSRRVDCDLSRCIHHMVSYRRLAQSIIIQAMVNDIEWSDSKMASFAHCWFMTVTLLQCCTQKAAKGRKRTTTATASKRKPRQKSVLGTNQDVIPIYRGGGCSVFKAIPTIVGIPQL